MFHPIHRFNDYAPSMFRRSRRVDHRRCLHAGHADRNGLRVVPLLRTGGRDAPTIPGHATDGARACHQILLFRRATGPNDRDRTVRMSDATAALKDLSAVDWWNSLPDSVPLHVHASTISVAWPIRGRDAAAHARVVPQLLRWTNCPHFCNVGGDWAQLRQRMAVLDPRLPVPRNVRMSAVLDFVGSKAQADGLATEACVALCRQALVRLNQNKLIVTTDPESGAITEVTDAC